jgi:predicted HAD superfamily phosphohydrolase YqeG
MGDQIFTDVWAGKRLGVRTILLPPIKDKRDIFTRFKRLLEKPILKYYRKRKEKSK